MPTARLPDIVPAEYPELRQLVWNRDPTRPLEAAQAFAIYERNWRHVDVARLDRAEAALIERLTQVYGGGHLLV